MQEIIIKNQKEFDALPASFEEYTRIIIRNAEERIIVRMARENSSVEAWGNSSVEARENSSVVARENSSVVARENSSVVARENSSVEAWGNSSVEARENSSVEAWGNSSVVAWGNSSVEAWGNVGVHLYSDHATVVLFMFAVCWELAKGKITKKSKTCTLIKPVALKGLTGWFESNGIEEAKKVILFKKVSKDFKTQEKTPNETDWSIGKTLEHSDWKPKENECGEGKFHACSRPYFCDEFRNERGDKYIAIEIEKKDLFAWENPDYPHKIAFRKGTVLYECDKFGKKK